LCSTSSLHPIDDTLIRPYPYVAEGLPQAPAWALRVNLRISEKNFHLKVGRERMGEERNKSRNFHLKVGRERMGEERNKSRS
jgi:hypothetical protein